MSYNNGTKIIAAGLINCLDGKNEKSYQSGSLIWKNLCDNYTASLVGNVTQSIQSSSLYFTGGYLNMTTSSCPLVTSSFSVNMWMKLTDLSTYSVPLSFGGSNTFGGALSPHPNDGRGLTYYAVGYRIQDNNTNFGNLWFNVVLTGNGAANGSRSMSMYRNSVFVGSSTFDYSFAQGLSNFVIGANQSAFGEYMRGYIGYVGIYNRALSSDEVVQNFNALKGRFSL